MLFHRARTRLGNSSRGTLDADHVTIFVPDDLVSTALESLAPPCYTLNMKQEERIQRIQKAEAFYASRMRPQLEPQYNGQFVAIDVDSGAYFLGESVKAACLLGSNKNPQAKFVCLRVGYPATRFVGSHA